jgi:hypothetical protein
MSSRASHLPKFLAIAAIMLAIPTGLLRAQKGQQVDDTGVRLRIEITGEDKPIDSASVYVRYVVKHTLAKDENVEMNIKTNQEGIALVPAVPKGKVIVQVIAPGWKTFGQAYDATVDQQVVKISLERPKRWY